MQVYLLPPDDRLVLDLLELEKYIYLHGSYALDQVVFRRVDGHFQAIVKAIRRNEPKVAYVSGDTWTSVLRNCGLWADKDLFEWTHDRYPSRRVQNLLKRP